MRTFVLYSRDDAAVAEVIAKIRAKNIECTAVALSKFDPKDREAGEYHVFVPGPDDDQNTDDAQMLRETFGERFGAVGDDSGAASQLRRVIGATDDQDDGKVTQAPPVRTSGRKSKQSEAD
jgi:hypothetical protein